MLTVKTTDSVTKICMQFPLQDIKWHCVKKWLGSCVLKKQIETFMLN